MTHHIAPDQMKLIAEQIRAIVGSDDMFFADVLEGETPIFDIVAELIRAEREREAQISACDSLIKEYTVRLNNSERAVIKYRTSMLAILDAVGLKSIKTDIGTVSRMSGQERLVIADGAEAPTQMRKITIEPDKAAIKKHLQAGEKIEGFTLEAGPDYVSIR